MRAYPTCLKLLVRMYQQLVGKMQTTVAATCLTPPKSISTGRWSESEELSYLGKCLDESLPSNGCTQNRQNLEQLNHLPAKPQPLVSPGI